MNCNEYIISISKELYQEIASGSFDSHEILCRLRSTMNILHEPSHETEYVIPSLPKSIQLESDHDVNNDLFTLFHWIGSLKTTKRTGWIQSGIPQHKVESIAEHMYRMAILTMVLESDTNNKHIDWNKCIKLSLIHDLTEAIVGDIPPSANIPKSVKHEMEREAIQKLSKFALWEKQVLELWNEYESQESQESIIVKELDRFEMLLQALEYESEHPNLCLESFYQSTKESTFSITREWIDKLRCIRKAISKNQ